MRKPPVALASRFTPCAAGEARGRVHTELDFDAVATDIAGDDAESSLDGAKSSLGDDKSFVGASSATDAAVEHVLDQVAEFGRSVSLSLSLSVCSVEEEAHDSSTCGMPRHPELKGLQERCRQLDREIAAVKTLLLAKVLPPS